MDYSSSGHNNIIPGETNSFCMTWKRAETCCAIFMANISTELGICKTLKKELTYTVCNYATGCDHGFCIANAGNILLYKLLRGSVVSGEIDIIFYVMHMLM